MKLEDEGYYLCKVMAEPQSLKQVIFLKVNVDLRVTPHNPLNVKLDEPVVIVCNSSYDILSYSSSSSALSSLSTKYLNKKSSVQQQSHSQEQHHPRLIWFKDGQHFPSSSSSSSAYSYATLLNEDEHFSHNSSGVTIQNENLNNFKIEHYAKPVLWSRIVFKSFKAFNIGKYTCKFRNQNVSTIISPYLGENDNILHFFFQLKYSNLTSSKMNLFCNFNFEALFNNAKLDILAHEFSTLLF